MKHRKRDTASGVSSINSNIARAMRVRMPKVPANRAPQVTVAQRIIIPPPTNTPPKNCRLRLIKCRSNWLQLLEKLLNKCYQKLQTNEKKSQILWGRSRWFVWWIHKFVPPKLIATQTKTTSGRYRIYPAISSTIHHRYRSTSWADTQHITFTSHWSLLAHEFDQRITAPMITKGRLQEVRVSLF